MINITKEEIIKLGHMSQINIARNDIPQLFEKIDAVLTYASHLKEIEAGQPGEALPRTINRVRSDLVIRTPAEPLLARAPVSEGHYYVVPTVLKS
jgi:aspartyl/glutamyl-tRNA(Asn/Gln) amidotransferase C subunit